MCNVYKSSYKNIARSISLLDKIAIFVCIVPCLGKTRIMCHAGCFFFKRQNDVSNTKLNSFISFQMGTFRGKRKVGLTFGRHKKSTYTTVKATTSDSTQYRSPVHKRARVSSTPRKTFASPCVGYINQPA